MSEASEVMSSSTPVAKVSDVPSGGTYRVTIGGHEVLLCDVDGKIFAIEDVCTHDGGALDQGELEGCRIMCPRHGAYFDVTTGKALTLPAILPLSTYTVRIEADNVFVDA
ncbi:MAG: non-heme iron oxygenase ferredoxin subunit [Candidatus Velthaea sp.]